MLIHKFKDYCALLFHKGVLMKDLKGLLVQQTSNVRSGRQLRFINLCEIIDLKDTVKSYIQEAIKIDKLGLKVALKKTSEFEMPDKFKNKSDNNPNFRKAFDKLTPGRETGHLLYFSSAKQSSACQSRVEKHIPQILAGKELEDE